MQINCCMSAVIMELSPELLQALHELYPPHDSIDALDFDCVQYINLRFPTEQSLSALEPVQAEIREEAAKARTEIEALLREQAQAGDEMRTLLGESRGTVASLRTHVGRMKEKAVDSERLVQEICADIRALDIAKKNLTLTITALKRLAMLSDS
jgi:ABC-type transporter Mla subunit MlaD